MDQADFEKTAIYQRGLAMKEIGEMLMHRTATLEDVVSASQAHDLSIAFTLDCDTEQESE